MTSTALLTRIHAEQLSDGEETCRRSGKVAFGDQARTVFEELDDLAGPGTPIFIHTSMDAGEFGPPVTWTATYPRYVESKGGAHLDRANFRPRSCRSEDASGNWAGFYEVTDLRRLSGDEQLLVGTLRRRDGGPYAESFVPEGPIIVSRRDDRI